MPKRSNKSTDPIKSANRVLDEIIAKHDPESLTIEKVKAVEASGKNLAALALGRLADSRAARPRPKSCQPASESRSLGTPQRRDGQKSSPRLSLEGTDLVHLDNCDTIATVLDQAWRCLCQDYLGYSSKRRPVPVGSQKNRVFYQQFYHGDSALNVR